jgi:hypothetical protein
MTRRTASWRIRSKIFRKILKGQRLKILTYTNKEKNGSKRSYSIRRRNKTTRMRLLERIKHALTRGR